MFFYQTKYQWRIKPEICICNKQELFDHFKYNNHYAWKFEIIIHARRHNICGLIFPLMPEYSEVRITLICISHFLFQQNPYIISSEFNVKYVCLDLTGMVSKYCFE